MLKAFEGMTFNEIASQLSCSSAAVTRDWHFARHWMQKELA
jgi:DNA-directed RNA polymerase specialized sigma24 family protein